jgi:hypothetical protein
MAQIVPFRMVSAREAPEIEPGSEGGAQIIIFPGVRRERHAETPAEPTRRTDPQPERDLLQLPD